jgi:hypothetical protein
LTAAFHVASASCLDGARAELTAPDATAKRNDGDARRHVWQTLAHTLALYGALAVALFGLMPAWVLAGAVPWLYVRLSLGLHELLHVRDATEVPTFHRLAIIFDTPFGLGFREHRAIHFAHHRYSASERDPELWQIEGGHLRAFANALTTPERALVNWIRERGLDAPLARDASFRLACFLLVASINPAVFAVYWLLLRVSIGAAGFVFHHLLHNRRGALGTYALPFPSWCVRAGRSIVGDEPMLILAHHRSHHLWPDVRARDLPDLAPDLALPPARDSGGLRTATTGIGRQLD